MEGVLEPNNSLLLCCDSCDLRHTPYPLLSRQKRNTHRIKPCGTNTGFFTTSFLPALAIRQRHMDLSVPKQIALAIMPKISAVLSFSGSSWIVVEIATSPQKRRKVYHRILISMSIYDLLESVWNFASTWPIPNGTPGVWGAVGSTGT